MPEGDTGVIGISGCIGEVMALPLFILLFQMSSLSRASDVSFLTIKRIWREPFRGVNTTTLERLAKALDVSVSDLFEEVPDE